MGVILFLVWILYCVILSVQVDESEEYAKLIPRILISGVAALGLAFILS